MAAIVGVRKALKASARRIAAESRAGRAREDASSHPLAALLLEQHDIGSQAARFADPSRLCLSSGDGEPPSERLGPFTCLADTPFFLRAVAKTLQFPSVLAVDVGSDHRPPLGPARGVGIRVANTGRESDTLLSEALQLQARIQVGKDPLPDNADLVLIDAHDGILSEAAWVDLIHSFMQVLSKNGVVVVRGPRDGGAFLKDGEKENKEARRPSAAWYERTHLWEAVATMACDRSYGVASAVGALDGGVILVRHRARGELLQDTGCGISRTGHTAEGGSSSGPEVAAPPWPLRFENLFLWATAERDTSSARAVEAVQAKFGGADAVRRYARRRNGRSECVNAASNMSGGDGVALGLHEPSPIAGGGGGGGGDIGGRFPYRRAKRGQIRVGAAYDDIASQHKYSAARVCLENHLKEHPLDVRAGFALEMILRAIGRGSVEKQVARLRAKMSEETGETGAALWEALHAEAAGAVMVGLLG